MKDLKKETKTKKKLLLVFSLGIVILTVIISVNYLLSSIGNKNIGKTEIVMPKKPLSFMSQLKNKVIINKKEIFSDKTKNQDNIVSAIYSPYNTILHGSIKDTNTKEIIPNVSIEIISKTGSYSTTSDKNGKYRISIPYSKNPALLATKSGYADLFLTTLILEPKNNEQLLNLELGSGKIVGNVLNKNGNPIENVEIKARSKNVNLANVNDPYGFYHAKTDNNGSFSISDINPGNYLVKFNSENYSPFEKEIELKRSEKEKEVEIILEKGKVIKGIVVSRNDGKESPVSEVKLLLEVSVKSDSYITAKSDSNGKFTFNNVPAKLPLTIKTLSPFHKRTEYYVESFEKEIKIKLPKSASLEGIVTYESGEAAAGKEVIVKDATYDAEDSITLKTKTDDNGYYKFTQIPSGYLRAIVKGEGARLNGNYIKMSPGEKGILNIELSNGYLVSGTVTDNEGRAVKDALLEFFGEMGGIGSVTTDSSGYYELFDVAPGRYTVFFEGTDRFQSLDRDFAVNDDTEFNIELEPADIYLNVDFVNTQFDLPEYINVELCNTENRRVMPVQAAQSLDTDSYLVKNLKSGNYLVRANLGEYTSSVSPVTLEPGGSEVSLDFLNCGKTKIQIVDAYSKKLVESQSLVGIRYGEKPQDGCFYERIIPAWQYSSVQNGELQTKTVCNDSFMVIKAQAYGYKSKTVEAISQQNKVIKIELEPGENKRVLLSDKIDSYLKQKENEDKL